MQTYLSSLTEESFSSHKKALEVKRSEKPKKLNEECRRYWTELTTGMYHFNRGEEGMRRGEGAREGGFESR